MKITACYYNHLIVIKSLGVDINKANNNGTTHFYVAAKLSSKPYESNNILAISTNPLSQA